MDFVITYYPDCVAIQRNLKSRFYRVTSTASLVRLAVIILKYSNSRRVGLTAITFRGTIPEEITSNESATENLSKMAIS
jgi:hypothetical protein